MNGPLNRTSFQLGRELQTRLEDRLIDWERAGKTTKLWNKDARLWTNSGEENWLGWLTLVEEQLEDLRPVQDAATLVCGSSFDQVVLLGMGGSSLCPDLWASTFPQQSNFPKLRVLDSIVPAQVVELESELQLEKTLFIVSSKSGNTIEARALMEYFFDRVQATAGPRNAGRQFIAITDPGTPLEEVARQRDFRRVYYGKPDVGGRFSALSSFGLVPAALMGLDIRRLLTMAQPMVHACRRERATENPGVVLGAIMAEAALSGRDKLTLVISPAIARLGAWLEQLIAESTGKDGKAIIPVDAEPLGDPDAYGTDRLFVYVRLASSPDPLQDRGIERLAAAGHPIVRIDVSEPLAITQEFFRWEVATSVAGAILGINPFDQPHVQLSKDETQRLLQYYQNQTHLPDYPPAVIENELKVFLHPSDRDFAEAASPHSMVGLLRAHLQRLKPGDYFALLAFLPSEASCDRLLQEIRRSIRDHYAVATTCGYGPRYLHSTGQAHKGGPNTGVFLLVTAEDAVDRNVPGCGCTFGTIKMAQALGDFQVLGNLGRRIVRVHLPAALQPGLERLVELVTQALS